MTGTPLRFGPFVIDPVSYRLTRDGTSLELAPKAFDLLLLLARQAGRLVTKDDILAALWPDVAVTDNALTQVVSDVRQTLGDSPASPKFIETVPRRGYRFIGDVEQGPQSSESLRGPDVPSTPQAAPTGPSVAGRTIAVAPFANTTGDASVAWLGAGIAETVANDLRTLRDLRVLDRLSPSSSPDDALPAARAAGAALMVVGSFQRLGAQVRITARAVDVRSGDVVAHAKADGALDDVFSLQDAIVRQLSTGLQITISAAAAARITARETASLDAYRSLTEGRLKLEALDLAEIPGAVAAFERALALDPRYALAHVGLAHAKFWQFQSTRAETRPDLVALHAAIDHAQRAIEIDPDIPEAHSALGFFLASAERRNDGVAACRRALALEPGNWRHQFRLGMAAWGEERLNWLDAVTAQYPAMPYAYFGRAMVHVARGALERAEQALRTGAANEQRATAGAGRFPASGLHWLLGLVKLAQGDAPGARVAFDRELQSPRSRLFADEYAREAWTGHGFALLAGGDATGAASMFERVVTAMRDHPRALIGLAAACRALGAVDRATSTSAAVMKTIADLKDGGRTADAAMVAALGLAMAGRAADAVAAVDALLEAAPYGSIAWMLPIEPALSAMRTETLFQPVLARLALRAR